MPKIYFQKMTPNGYKQIEDEIEQLKLDRPAKIKQLQEARALGDLSENAEYSAAKRDLRHLESRLRYLNKQLQYAENDLETYQIVGKQEVNVDDNKISFVSPIGKAIMHKKVGHTATVVAPAGSYTVKIISISIWKKLGPSPS